MLIGFRRVFSTRLLLIGLMAGVTACPVIANADQATYSAPVNSSVFRPHILAYAQQHPGAVPVDPHVFVQDPNAPETTGPEGIHHTVGLRPARLADERTMALFDSQGDPLSLNLAHWLSSKGTAQSIRDTDGLHVRLAFSHLIPFGVYSVFFCKSTAGGFAMSALHVDGGPTVFTADGDGGLQVTLPLEHELASNESLLLIYHSDNVDHSDQAGDLGTNAHVQLVLIKPAVEHALPEGDQGQSPSDNAPL